MSLNEALTDWAPGLAAVVDRFSVVLSLIPGPVWAGVYALWFVGSIVFLLMQQRAPTATLAWIFGFISLPVVSAFVYFLFGPRKLKRRKLRRALARRMAEQAIPDHVVAEPSAFVDESEFSDLAQVAISRGDPSPSRAISVQLYDNGDATYAAIERAMNEATVHIHLEYYIFEPDEIGSRWRELLTDKAATGVEVRILLDALGSQGCSPDWWKPLTAAGGQVRYFNPPRLFKPRPGRLNFRTHRKIAIVDGRVGFTGGINICRDNSQQQCGPNAWRDTHLRVDGAPTAHLQTVFLEDWVFAAERDTTWLITNRDMADLPPDVDRWFPSFPTSTGPWVQIVDSGPDEPSADIHRFFFTAITRAKKRIWITTPYFVPDEPILTALSTA
ncbi:MAG: phospholipase D-like domain-containing protein, partial [Burkholderiaceae bacterium]